MPVNIEKLKEKYERKQAQRADRFQLKDGENYIRILPPSLEYLTEDVDYISIEYLCHYNIGLEGKKHAEICPRSFGSKNKCPICETCSKLYKGSAEDKALGKDLYARRRILFNVIDLKEPEKGVQILETGPKIYEDVVVFVTNAKWGDLLDLDEGRNIVVYKTPGKESSSGYNEYNVTPDPDKTSVRDVLPENWKEKVNQLQKAVNPAKSYEDLEKALAGEEDDNETDKDASSHKTTTVVEDEDTPQKDERTEEQKAADKKKTEPEKKEEAPKEETKEEPKEEKKEEPKDDKKRKDCFGEKYKVSSPECKECEDKTDCRSKFLDV